MSLAAGALALLAGRTDPGTSTFSSSPSPSAQFSDSGVFELSLAGKPIGTESFEIRSSAQEVEARAEIHLRVKQDGKTIDVKTYPDLVLDTQLQPLTYTWKQKGTQSSQLEVDFRVSPAQTRYKTVNGQEDLRTFALPKDVVVVDDNVVHHYQLVVGRYRLTGGGERTFKAFIPQEALPGDLSVQEVGTEPAPANGAMRDLRHLVVTSELAHVSLWVDEQQHLQQVSIPQAQFEARRKM
jgi:hypothetical protein